MPPVIHRVWAMPSANTFSIPPIRDLVARYLSAGGISVDPFARASRLASITNDLDPKQPTDFHLSCEDFARELAARVPSIDLVLFDPPYSYRQAVEVYAGVGKEWTNRDQQQVGRWSTTKDLLARQMGTGAIAISFGWSTTGFGKSRRFAPIEYLVVNHGSAHHDTLVTVERKLDMQEMLA